MKVLGDSTGLHLIAEFQEVEFPNQRVNEIANRYKVQIYPVELHTIKKGMHRNKIILGYGNLTFEEIKEGIHRLKQALL